MRLLRANPLLVISADADGPRGVGGAHCHTTIVDACSVGIKSSLTE